MTTTDSDRTSPAIAVPQQLNGDLDQTAPSSSSSSITDEKTSPPEFHPNTRFYLAFAALAVLTLMVALDGTSISVALPIIAKKLNGTAIEAFWAGTSFLLCSTVFQPNYASFSHIFGRKPMVLTAITFFLIGVLVAALANNFTTLLIGRSLQGVGGGGIIAMTEIIVTDLVPLRYRGQWVGIIGGMWAIGSVTGPIIGGFVVPIATTSTTDSFSAGPFLRKSHGVGSCGSMSLSLPPVM
jgi:MFS family permease